MRTVMRIAESIETKAVDCFHLVTACVLYDCILPQYLLHSTFTLLGNLERSTYTIHMAPSPSNMRRVDAHIVCVLFVFFANLPIKTRF